MKMITARQIGTLEPGKHRAAPGLYLHVRKSGSRAWIARVTENGRLRDFGLGSADTTTLKQARSKALAIRSKIANGIAIESTRKPSATPTFLAIVQEWIGCQNWKATTRKANEGTINNHVLPRLGKHRINTLTAATVIDAVKGIAKTSVVEAKRSTMMLKGIMEYATAREYVPFNVVANGTINAGVPELRSHKTVNLATMAYQKVGAFLATLGDSVSHSCLAFIVHTALRSNEARGLLWTDYDAAARTITIPGARMKGKVALRVPLSVQAQTIIESRRGQHETLIFGSTRKGATQISPFALSSIVKGHDATVHGFRASFRVWASETGVDSDAAENALAHKIGSSVRQAYDRTDRFDARRLIMQAWSDYIAPRG